MPFLLQNAAHNAGWSPAHAGVAREALHNYDRHMEEPFVVYILKGTKSRYIGCTSDIERRLNEHNSNITFFTRNKGPWKLEWISRKMNRSEALKLEKLLKKQKGGTGEKRVRFEYHE